MLFLIYLGDFERKSLRKYCVPPLNVFELTSGFGMLVFKAGRLEFGANSD